MTLDAKTLNQLKESLVAKKTQIEKELDQFATKNSSGEYHTDFPDDLGNERSENATEVEEYTDRLGVEKSLETQLTDINDALARMEEGSYGVDVETGEQIDVDRLRAYPAARNNVPKT